MAQDASPQAPPFAIARYGNFVRDGLYDSWDRLGARRSAAQRAAQVLCPPRARAKYALAAVGNPFAAPQAFVALAPARPTRENESRCGARFLVCPASAGGG